MATMATMAQTHPLISIGSSATVQEAARLIADCSIAAHDVMTAPAIACRDEAFFEEVAKILADRDISGMLVVDAANRVVGVISEQDIAYALGGRMVRLALRRHNENPLHGVAELPREARRAKQIMTTPALTVPADAHLEEVARLMRVHQVNRIPVVDDDRLIGVRDARRRTRSGRTSRVLSGRSRKPPGSRRQRRYPPRIRYARLIKKE